MKSLLLSLLILVTTHLWARQSTEITFIATDSITIYGDLYEVDKNVPSIILFHQGGSNARGEYGTIIPELLKMNFNILAIDQRLGGQYYGSYNRTLAKIKDHSFTNPYHYCDAYNNLEGALDFLLEKGFKGKILVWGSSYSASLAIQLAVKRKETVDAVLAFSPAASNAMKGCRPNKYYERLEVPCLVLKPPLELQSDESVNEFERIGNLGVQTYAAEYGVHGSSMLVEERVGHNVDKTWQVVQSFLREIAADQ